MSEQNDQDIEQLLAAAGQRQNPPEDMRARVYAATLAEWQALPEQSAQTRPSTAGDRRSLLALAASAIGSSVLPAVRAVRVSPVVALRSE